MDFNQIKELINIVNLSSITQFELQFEQVILKLSKTAGVATTAVAPVAESVAGDKESIPVSMPVPTQAPQPKPEPKDGFVVKSPIVGTYYSAPSPEAQKFVKLNQEVKKGDVLCIIEAMKVMNEVKSPCDGVIAEIYAENEQILEYNQPIFLIV